MTNNVGATSRKATYSALSLEETHMVGGQIAARLGFPSCVYLQGNMGAGKTTLTKSIIQAFGYSGEVTSPTYNLIQEYHVPQGTIYHMDLYRLEDPGELEYLALEDMWCDACIFLIEWPEKGVGYLQPANVTISISKIFDNPSEGRNIILEFL